MNLKVVIVGAAAAMAVSSAASAENFKFMFTNDPAFGNVPGTVSGEVIGLTDNATSSARNVVVDSYPTGVTGLPATPFTVAHYASDLGLFINQNQFTVSGGSITAGVYQIFGGYFDMNVSAGPYFYNSLVSPDALTRVQNQPKSYLGGVTFTAVPEPGAWAMMLLGLGGLGVALRARRRIAPQTA